jgi:hypothetical protein
LVGCLWSCWLAVCWSSPPPVPPPLSPSLPPPSCGSPRPRSPVCLCGLWSWVQTDSPFSRLYAPQGRFDCLARMSRQWIPRISGATLAQSRGELEGKSRNIIRPISHLPKGERINPRTYPRPSSARHALRSCLAKSRGKYPRKISAPAAKVISK